MPPVCLHPPVVFRPVDRSSKLNSMKAKQAGELQGTAAHKPAQGPTVLRAENNKANRPPPACKYIQRTEQGEPSLLGALRLPPPSVTQPPQLPLDVACAAPPASRRANLEQPQRSPCPKALPNPPLPAPPPVHGQGGADTMLLRNTCPSRNRPALPSYPNRHVRVPMPGCA